MEFTTLLTTADITIQQPLTASGATKLTGNAKWPILLSSVFDRMNGYGPVYVITTNYTTNQSTGNPARYLFFLGNGDSEIPSITQAPPIYGIPNGTQFNSLGYHAGLLPGTTGRGISPISLQEISAISVVYGGSNYKIGDILPLNEGSTFETAILQVTRVNQFRAITEVSILYPGSYLALPDDITNITTTIGTAIFSATFSYPILDIITSNKQEIDEICLVARGIGYSVDQILSLVGGLATPYPIIKVIAIDHYGGIADFKLMVRGAYMELPIDLSNVPASSYLDGDNSSTNALFAITVRKLTVPYNTQHSLITIDVDTGGSHYKTPSLSLLDGGTYTTPATITLNSDVKGSITSVSVADGGVYNTLPSNPVSIQHGNAKLIATFGETDFSDIFYQIGTIIKIDGGSQYQPNQIITLIGGTYDVPIILRIDNVDDNGYIVNFSIMNSGVYISLPSSNQLHADFGSAIFQCTFIERQSKIAPYYAGSIVVFQQPTDGAEPPPDDGMGPGNSYNKPLFLDENGNTVNPNILINQYTDIYDYFSQFVTFKQASKCSGNLVLYSRGLADFSEYDLLSMLRLNPNMLKYFFRENVALPVSAIETAIKRNPNIISLLANKTILTSNMIYQAIKRNGAVLRFFINNPKMTPDLIILGLQNNGDAVQYMANHPLLSFPMIKYAVKNSPDALMYVISNPKSTAYMITTTLQKSPSTLKYVADNLRLTGKIIEPAFAVDGTAIQYIASSRNSNLLLPSIMNTAVTQNPDALQYIATHPRLTTGVISTALNKKPKDVQYVGNSTLLTESLMRMVVNADQTNLKYIAHNPNLPADLKTLAQQLGYL